ncbi:MAG: hypothetical protein EOO71_03665 [Myxococcaceae bacterium]|nr:MAG: hypothetical protein EOO71_03665 [Myxococcaceae bacterium]
MSWKPLWTVGLAVLFQGCGGKGQLRLDSATSACRTQPAEKLDELRPGRFSIEPTYQYDQDSEKTTWLSQDKVDSIRRDGDFFELKGSLVPDVVLHEGHPLKIQAAFDFKFPCIDLSVWPKWRDYPQGHPYEGSSQRDMYIKAFRTQSVFRVSPWLGVGP